MEILLLSTTSDELFIENTAEVFQEDSVVPVCPSITRWTAHDRVCKSICNGYKQYLAALSVCVNEQIEPDAMGIFEQLSSPQFISTILVLRDVFTVVQQLKLVLQKSVASLCLADIPVYLYKSYSSLEKLKSCKESRPHFTLKKLENEE